MLLPIAATPISSSRAHYIIRNALLLVLAVRGIVAKVTGFRVRAAGRREKNFPCGGIFWYNDWEIN